MRRSFVAAVTALGMGALAACTATPATTPVSAVSAPASANGGASAPSAAAPTTSAAPLTPVTLNANVGPEHVVTVDTPVTVTAQGGTVTSVTLTYSDPKAGAVTIDGDRSADGTTWTARALLEPATTYHLAMTGLGTNGATTTTQSSFTTQTLGRRQQITPTLIQDGGTLGIAMPVVIRFDVPVTDRASFERKMTVTSVPAQQGGWAWFSDTEAHWRPKVYWQPGTKVSVNLNLNGVSGGNGTYGKQSVTGGFTIGSALTMHVDLSTHQLDVTINGALAKTIPITGGRPGMATRSGTKVVIEKLPVTIMDAATTGVAEGSPGYYRTTVYWDMRETWSGEFLHAAPWSVGSQGKANVSHGCVGMSTANAEWLYNQVKVGDPVVAVNSGRALEKGNGWTDWNVSFEEFVKDSALAGH